MCEDVCLSLFGQVGIFAIVVVVWLPIPFFKGIVDLVGELMVVVL